MIHIFLNGIQNGGYNGLMYSAIFFSEIYAPEKLYIESKMMALRLLVSETWWYMAATGPTGEIWLGTRPIAKFTYFGIISICAKFHAFITKCTIFL